MVLNTKIDLRNERILITGHTGFKGRWLNLFLTKLGANVFGVSKDQHFGSNFSLPISLPKENQKELDLQNMNLFMEFVDEIQPTIIFHLAAQSIVSQSYKSPIQTFEINFLKSIDFILECEKRKYVKKIIVATTDKCYDNNESGLPFKETDRLGGKDPYSASKAALEMAINGLRSSNLIHKTITVRAGNVIGGGDWNEFRLIPDAARSMLSGKALELRYPNAIRPWQYVLDVLWGYILCTQLPEQTKNWSFNFGPDVNSQKLNVAQVINFLQQHVTISVKSSQFVDNFESINLWLDSNRAQVELGWKPEYGIYDFLGETIEWYVEVCKKGTDSLKYSEKLLDQYLSKKI